jgi:hypothetical protein
MKKYLFMLLLGLLVTTAFNFLYCQQARKEIRGEPEAILEAKEMVESMGGLEIWSKLKSLHFVHVWHTWNRIDAYTENEILDLTGPRSRVEMKSEIYHRLRAYSPEYRYWNIINREFAYAGEEAFQAAMERAPFSLYRIARGIATGDPYYEVRFGQGEFSGSRQLEFYGPDGAPHGWILLNARKEPLVWATTQYRYTFGPMKAFGNLKVPNWAVTGNGAVTYEMVSLTGSAESPDSTLFQPPRNYREP